VGQDGNGHLYSGDSAVIDPRGAATAMEPSVDSVLTINLDHKALEDFRSVFPVGMEADRFDLRP
jgi:predicted amidohydrolase